MVATLLDERLDTPVHRVAAGDADGIAAEIVRYVADVVASDTKALLDDFAERIDRRATGASDVEAALEAGRVETLLVHDDADSRDGNELIDRCIAAALRTDADVRVVPDVAILDHGVAAILRW